MNPVETDMSWGFDLDELFIEPDYDDAEINPVINIVGTEEIVLDQSQYFSLDETTDLSWNTFSWEQTFSGLDYLLAMQLCVCPVDHGGFQSISNGFESIGNEMMIGRGGEHHGHEHCEMPNCDGHFDENGNCEKCGARRKNRL